MGRATLAPRLGMSAEVPPLRPRPTLGMDDMGMGGMSHGSMGGMSSGSMAGMDHGAMGTGPGAGAAMSGMDMGSMDMGGMNMRDESLAQPDMKVGVGVDVIAMNPQDSAGEPPLGPSPVGHRVLVYPDPVDRRSCGWG